MLTFLDLTVKKLANDCALTEHLEKNRLHLQLLF